MLIRIIMTCFLLVMVLYAQQGPTKIVMAEGLAGIYHGNIAAATDRAVSDALRKSVEQSMGLLINAETIVEHHQLISDRILARTNGYVRKYEITNRRRVDSQTYAVTIRAEVQQNRLRDDLVAAGLIIAGKHHPRLMILPASSAAADANFEVLAAVLTDRLISRGFDLVDLQVTRAYHKRTGVLQQIGGNSVAVRTAAIRQGADILILLEGKSATSLHAPAAMLSAGLSLIHGSVSLKAVRADDGRILATVTAEGKSAHYNGVTGGQRALSEATQTAADQISSKILSAWREDLFQGQTVSIQIDGLATYRDLVNVIARFKGLRSIREVIERSYTLGSASLEFKSTADAATIALEITAFNFAPYHVEIIARGANTLALQVRS